MSRPTSPLAQLLALENDADRMRMAQPSDVAAAAAALLEQPNAQAQIALILQWTLDAPNATHFLIGVIADDFVASVALGPAAAGVVASLSPVDTVLSMIDEVLIAALPMMLGPWLDAALERPRVRLAHPDAVPEGWTSLGPPPLHRAWSAGTPFPSLDTIAGTQARMNWLGIDPGPIDGVLGARTLRALHRYQVEQGLEPTGTLDWDTRDSLALDCPVIP